MSHTQTSFMYFLLDTKVCPASLVVSEKLIQNIGWTLNSCKSRFLWPTLMVSHKSTAMATASWSSSEGTLQLLQLTVTTVVRYFVKWTGQEESRCMVENSIAINELVFICFTLSLNACTWMSIMSVAWLTMPSTAESPKLNFPWSATVNSALGRMSQRVQKVFHTPKLWKIHQFLLNRA